MVRQRSAKPLFSGSNPLAASNKNNGLDGYGLAHFSFVEPLVEPLFCGALLKNLRTKVVNNRWFGAHRHKAAYSESCQFNKNHPQ